MQKPKYLPCIPPAGPKSRTGRDGSTKSNDGYRLIVQRDGKVVRLWTKNGYDWSTRFPLIREAALRNRQNSFVVDGEAVLLGVDGRSDFDGLHSRQHDDEVQFYAFDMLVSDGGTSENCLSACARRASPDSWRGARTASIWHLLRRARSDRTYSGTLA
jgi:bifunctional non-homologous end joining protein LigD